MAASTLVEMAVEQPLAYRVDALLNDVRPLRAQFEDAALALRTALLQQGVTDPLLEAALDLRYVGQTEPMTVPFPLEIENAAVCLSDPLPLDGQALRQAVATFRDAYSLRAVVPDVPIEVVRLRVRGQGFPIVNSFSNSLLK